MKIGLIVDEYFGGAGTAFGGYGFLARHLIAKHLSKFCEIDVLLGKSDSYRFTAERHIIDNINVYRLPKRAWFAQKWLAIKNYDAYLSIELTDDYVLKNEKNKNKKLVLWIQDPRPMYEWDEINTVKLFTETCYYNQAIYDLVHDWYKQGRVRFISQAHFLNQKAIDLYSLDRNIDITYLPNPIEIDEEFDIKKHQKQNKIIFLGRLESVKRGWLFCEIAKRLPEYQFYVLGQTFRESDRNKEIFAQYQQIPNLHFVGHVEGDEKTEFLKDAKILVNTSIHEALPISFLEALSYGTLIVSNRNPDDLTAKFGVYVGNVLGDGFNKVDLYVSAIQKLMGDEQAMQDLSLQAIEYIKAVHNIKSFQKNILDILNEAT